MDSRHGRLDPVSPKRPLALAREYVLLTHIANLSCGDPLVITSWLTNHNRDFETSLGLANPRAGLQLRA